MYSAPDIDAIIAAVGGLPPGRVEFFASHFLGEPGGGMIETPCSQPWMVRRRLKLRWRLIMHADYASTFERVDHAHLWPRYYADVAAQCRRLLESSAALKKNVMIASAGIASRTVTRPEGLEVGCPGRRSLGRETRRICRWQKLTWWRASATQIHI